MATMKLVGFLPAEAEIRMRPYQMTGVRSLRSGPYRLVWANLFFCLYHKNHRTLGMSLAMTSLSFELIFERYSEQHISVTRTSLRVTVVLEFALWCPQDGP
jgi:uncharacterized RDD family membrane protein YckC